MRLFGRRPTQLLRSRLVQNVMTLSGVQLLTYLLPLLTIPYLTRVLTPTGWGTVVFYQAFGAILTQVIEFGFYFSGARDVAVTRDSPMGVGRVLAGVIGAKALLTVGSLVVATAAFLLVPQLRDDPRLMLVTLLFAVGQAFNLNWFYQGLERMRVVGLLTASTKVGATVALFVVVRSPDDGWLVVLTQAVAAWIAAFAGQLVAHRTVLFVRPTAGAARRAMTRSWRFFLLSASTSLYTAANGFILGMFAPVREVGYYAAAERVTRVLLALDNPITNAVFPRVSFVIQSDRTRAAALVRTAFAVMLAAALAMGIGLFVFAPLIVRLLFGDGYGPAVTVLRLFALLPVVATPSVVLGLQWTMPLGHERQYVRIVMLAGVMNLIVASALAPTFGAEGMAIAVLTTETFVSVTVFGWLRARRLDPFRPSLGDVALPLAPVHDATTAS